jgi:hypothetical protein
MVDIAGPNDSPADPLGDGGSTRGRLVAEEWFACGAIITGRRTFDIANGLSG